ncbi:MAG: zinc-binding dehydrogenase [Alphaproteobacteria bacterium]|nr:zinc-binding dehydrogenase [Alphaproteobacteria bacterium]MBU1515387.1 zinc-binding dehydrogenase [Alphaproteobacteria bacterium]MBU2092978.1 zinc-binding dehydrogenase [Alphaproteobacteria bacterium]MBU2150118.1 zinc-binding dehydrogenase [Alphaproteobacteria bacterium]MBU2309923.1 zinc-binding dehydrogenase [Alphaproteobacteria bacterium]
MQAVVRRNGALVCAEVADPVPGAGQVLLRTLTCGICGSDLHAHIHMERRARTHAKAGRPVTTDPARDMVFGHEFCGQVLDYGPDAERRFEPGARVVALPYATGPAGRETVGFSNRFPGGYGELVCVDANMLMAVPDHVSDQQAAMVEPFAVGAHAVAEATLDAGSVVMVIGCGPVGLAVVASLKARGFGPIIAVDYSPGRRAMAERLGADVIVDPAAQSPHSHWSALGVNLSMLERQAAQDLGQRVRKPVVFECVGVPGVLQSIIQGVAPGAQIIVAGVCMEEDRFEPSMAINKQLQMRFVAAYTVGEFAGTLADIAEGRIDVAPVISGVVGRSGVAAAFQALAQPDSDIKIIIESGRA